VNAAQSDTEELLSEATRNEWLVARCATLLAERNSARASDAAQLSRCVKMQAERDALTVEVSALRGECARHMTEKQTLRRALEAFISLLPEIKGAYEAAGFTPAANTFLESMARVALANTQAS
jgi:hypothetical protein